MTTMNACSACSAFIKVGVKMTVLFLYVRNLRLELEIRAPGKNAHELLLSMTFVSPWTFVFLLLVFLGGGFVPKFDESICPWTFSYREVEVEWICVPTFLVPIDEVSIKCPTASLQKAPMTYYILQGNIPKV